MTMQEKITQAIKEVENRKQLAFTVIYNDYEEDRGFTLKTVVPNPDDKYVKVGLFNILVYFNNQWITEYDYQTKSQVIKKLLSFGDILDIATAPKK